LTSCPTSRSSPARPRLVPPQAHPRHWATRRAPHSPRRQPLRRRRAGTALATHVCLADAAAATTFLLLTGHPVVEGDPCAMYGVAGPGAAFGGVGVRCDAALRGPRDSGGVSGFTHLLGRIALLGRCCAIGAATSSRTPVTSAHRRPFPSHHIAGLVTSQQWGMSILRLAGGHIVPWTRGPASLGFWIMQLVSRVPIAA
jgi:hypothetical protein